jgi:hypothetical protein
MQAQTPGMQLWQIVSISTWFLLKHARQQRKTAPEPAVPV